MYISLGKNGHMFIILKHEYDLMSSLDIKLNHTSIILYQKHCYQVNFSMTMWQWVYIYRGQTYAINGPLSVH